MVGPHMASHRPPRLDRSTPWPSASTTTRVIEEQSFSDVASANGDVDESETTLEASTTTRSHSLVVDFVGDDFHYTTYLFNFVVSHLMGLWLIDDLNFYTVIIMWCWVRTWYRWGGLICGLWFVVIGLFWENQNVCCWWGLILVSGFVDWFIFGFIMELGLWIVVLILLF